VPTDVYKDYLKSPEWREKARLRVHLDRYECKYCGSEVKSRIDDSHSPNVHHFHYRNIMNENVYEDLVTLCKTCHNNLHKNYSIEEMEVEIKTHGVAYK
jgi:5-methylcytosine-specific restriction endonuclease McrA